MAAILHFIKPKNKLEEGGRSAAPVQQDAEEPEKICPNCRKHIPLSHLWADQMVCSCGYHFRMKARQRILGLVDKNSFVELEFHSQAGDPIGFPGYPEKLESAREISGEDEAVICGTASVQGKRVCLFAMEPYFRMGSMGCVVGEKITSLFEYALKYRYPVVG